MGNGIGAELYIGAERSVSDGVVVALNRAGSEMSYFFMMMNLNAFPSVWPSSMNSNEAAVSVEPGSC